MEFFSIIVEKIADHTIERVVRQVGYVIYLKRNVENLKSEVEELVDAKERVQHSVDEALRKCDKIETDVEKWLRKVDEMIAEANEFLEDENQVKKKCLFGLCPNLISRYRPSRKARKLAQKVVEIQNRGAFPSVSYTTPPKDIWTNSVGYYQAFESRFLIVTEIMKELADSNIHMIGVYGMAGVGKTTLVKEIARRAEEEELFDKVAKVEVRQNPDLKRIQKEIAEKFGLRLDENLSIAGRARLLADYINNNRNILVILDDVWDEFGLESVGLPIGICKILLTSRDRDILSSKMGTQKQFQLEVLEENETWSLFENMVGEDSVRDPDIRSVAIEVAKRCAGLPVLVVTVAKALKGRGLHSWKDALRLLKKSDGKGMLEKAYSGIEWSYNQLEDDEAKSLFLFVRKIGRKIIYHKDLLKYTVGLGLFKDVNTIEEADNRLHSLVDVLKDSCLLLHANNDEFVMHDLVRDVARSIASRDEQFLSEEFEQWPSKQFLERCSMISLGMIANIPQLPEELECPMLQVFVLGDENESRKIPPNFFKEMKELKVLDLTGFHFWTLPPSIHFPENLRTLCLDSCVLVDIAILGKLKSLEILSFINSSLKQLPKEIGQLTKLRLLDLGNCHNLEVIYPNVISSLTCLEELNITEYFDQWEIEGIGTSERSNASLSELKHLSHLTTLGIRVKDASQLPIDCFSEKLVNFNISIGGVWNWYDKYGTSKTLKLKLSQANQLHQGLKTLMNKSVNLYLDVLERVADNVCQLDTNGFPRLKNLHVQNNPEILQIVNRGSSSHVAFPILEELFLFNLVSLDGLCSGQLPRGSFRHLTIMEVEKCPQLKNLFSFSTVLHFLQLQRIQVVDCNNIKEIVLDEKEENFEVQVNHRIEFFQLRFLTLQRLPELTSFASNNNKNISNNEIDRPMEFFNHKELVAFPKLVENLTSLIVDGCGGFRFLSSSSMAINFVQLKNLRISRCQNMVEIRPTEEDNGIEEKILDNMFPKLESLELDTLANLETFCSSATYLEFSCLNTLIIKDCAKLGPFILDRMSKSTRDAAVHYLFDENVGFPGLEKLIVKRLHKLTNLWHTQLDPNLMTKQQQQWQQKEQQQQQQKQQQKQQQRQQKQRQQKKQKQQHQKQSETECYSKELVAFPKLVENLTTLIVDGCGGLRFLSSSSMAINFVQLKELRIRRCQSMVEVISTEEYNGTEEKILDNMFPKLEYLRLDTLANLETFCSSATYLEFSCLNTLIIQDCTKLGPFILDRMSKSIRDAAVHYLFDEKVGFPGLEKLVIKGLHKLTTLWRTQLDPNSFCKLTEIFVEDCQSLIHVLVPCILKRLESGVKVLNIRNCDSLEAVFNVKETDGALLSPQSALIFSCRNLCEVEIVNCRSLKNVFPASVARNTNLEKLQKLSIQDCEMLEQIVGEEVGVEVEAIICKFVFPSVNEMILYNLPQLGSFYPGMHTSKWPSLIDLQVSRCDKLEMLAAESSCFRQQHHQLGMPAYNQVFFLCEKDSFSNLKKLQLDVKEISWGSLPVDFFKIKHLVIGYRCIISAVPPSVLFRKCHNLEILVVYGGNFEEIFIHEGSLDGEEHQGWTLTQVKTLRIGRWVNLMYVWKGNSHLAGPVFPNLETLEVVGCPRLKNIVSSAISFCNIVELEVTNCDGMKHLISYSVAKSVINLKKMTVQNCQRMIEIVASDDDHGDGGNEITFSRLEYLELSDLPNLKGFCSRNYNVRFPLFITISVFCCIEMKISFDGVLLDDSKREKVQIIEDEDDDDNNDDNRGGGGADDHNNDNENNENGGVSNF